MKVIRLVVLSAALAVAALTMPVGPALAQMDSREGIALQNQILELRRDIQTLRDQISAGGAAAPKYRNDPQPNRAPNDMLANLLDRVSQLEDAVRQLQGRADETANRLQHTNDDLAKQIADMNFRVQTLEGGRGGGGGGPPPPTNLGSNLGGGTLGGPPVVPSEGAQPPRTPETAMQQGNAALARRDYASAEAAAREILATRGPRAYDAQFLLAQSLLGKRDFQQAALAYDDAYNRGRTGVHAQDALLGLANALGAIGEKRSACETLTRLHAEFPQARVDVRDAATAMRQRTGCS